MKIQHFFDIIYKSIKINRIINVNFLHFLIVYVILLYYNKVMKETINLVQFSKNVPLSFSVIKFDNIFLHMHSLVQLVIVLDGEFECFIDDKKYIAKESDIFIINPKTYHKFDSINKESTILSVLIDQNGFGLDEIESENIFFNLNSMELLNHPKYETIKYLIFSIIKFNTMDNINSIYTNKAIAYSLFAQLMNDFHVNIQESEQRRTNYDTITRITAYINDHYAENLSLSFIAEKFNYTISYLSRLFKNSMNTNFKHYYDDLRINFSLNDLLFTNKNLEEIALAHGFENARSYLRAFSSIFKVFPSKYRKDFKKNSKSTILDSSELKKKSIEKILYLYDQTNSKNTNQNYENIRDTEEKITIDFKSKATKISQPQTMVLELENPSLIMDIDYQKCLKNIQKDIKFKYITINNILKYSSDKTLLFYHLDRIISFLDEIDLLPYFKFNYDIENDDETSFLTSISSVLDFFKIFPKEKVEKWMINLSFSSSFIMNKTKYDNFLIIYNKFYSLFKKSYKNINIGSPSFNKSHILSNYYYKDFISYMKTKFLDVSFISINWKDEENNSLTKNKDEIKDFINYLKSNDLYFENKMYFEKINFSSTSLLNDTLYSSAYLSKNLIDNIKSISSFSNLGFIDSNINSSLFSGSNCLFTYNLIKKPSYHAYSLFSKLGNQLLKKSNNYIVTLKENKIYILLNNYSHYSDLYAENQYYQISEQERYHCFPKSTNIKFSFQITNLPYKECKIKTTILSKTNGSSFDKWIEIGAPTILNKEELESLKNQSEMSFHISNKLVIDSKVNIESNVVPLETKLIEITFNK